MEVGIPIKILLIEAELNEINLTEAIFEDSKLLNELHVTRSVREAIDKLREIVMSGNLELPDLLIIDFFDCFSEGCELLGELAEDCRLRSIPIIALLADDSEKEFAERYQLPFISYLYNPITFEQILRVVGEIKELGVAIVKKTREER